MRCVEIDLVGYHHCLTPSHDLFLHPQLIGGYLRGSLNIYIQYYADIKYFFRCISRLPLRHRVE